MIRLFTRRSADVSYLVRDAALELDGVRRGPAQWAPLGPARTDDPGRVLDGPPGHVLGYDLVFAAPRPVSCLLAIGDEAEQRAVVAVHRAAVAGALTYLERRALVVHRRILGESEELPARWGGAVGFTHGVNRAGEPHLHDHVLVGARSREWRRQVDARALVGHLAAADALYRAGLREGVGRDTGRASWRSWRGQEHVAGVDEGVRATWPGRAADREPKRAWSREEILERWRSDLARAELVVAVPTPGRWRDTLDEHAFAGAFEGVGRIARQQVVEAWANAATFGATPVEVERAVDRWYPELAEERGFGTLALSTSRARMLGHVRTQGARPLGLDREDHSIPSERSRGRDGRDDER
jgi:hypothetical protein